MQKNGEITGLKESVIEIFSEAIDFVFETRFYGLLTFLQHVDRFAVVILVVVKRD